MSGPQVRSRLGARSLTSRLITGVVALVVLLVLAIGSSTYLALHYFLYERLDQQLVPLARANAFGARQYLLDQQGSTIVGPFRGTQKVYIDVLTPSGSSSQNLRLRPSPGVVQMDLTLPSAQRVIADPDQPMTVVTTHGESLRVSVHRIFTAQLGDLYIATGVPIGEVTATLHRLVAIELLIGGGAVVVALLATYGGVRFSLRGLRQVSTTAREVAAELSPSGTALQRRVPVTEQGTEVAQLTESFNTLLAATETQFAARVHSEERMRQFLADASHELRTPLTSIRGYAELTRMQRAAGQPGEDNLDRIESEGMRMSRLVEDLLLLARGDAAHSVIDHVRIDVGELLEESVDGARAAFPDRIIDLDAMQPLAVVGDPDQLLRVVRNLVTNAVVHTRPGPPVRVRAFASGPGVAIQVVDAGPGLPPEEAARVFERFWRADKARSRARGGTGLGMAIVATIVQAHGGTVQFDSSVEAGSTVTVWLPAAP